MFIPQNLKLLRAALNMSQEEFGENLGVTKDAMKGYETGKSVPSVEFWIKVKNLTGLSIEDFLYQSLTADYFPSEMSFKNLEEPSIAYRRKLNLYDVRNMVQEIERLRQEIEEIKKANPPKSE
jgi:transcriptional regulator with XRE-family HTH domain